jgi:TPR repeat protein
VPPDFAIAVSWYQKAADQGNAEAQRGWLTEIIADYIRYYRYQPETHSADIKSPRRAAAAGHDGGYGVTANFLNWATNRYNPSLVENLNALMRTASYNDEVWGKLTGHSLPELGESWKQSLIDALLPPQPLP